MRSRTQSSRSLPETMQLRPLISKKVAFLVFPIKLCSTLSSPLQLNATSLHSWRLHRKVCWHTTLQRLILHNWQSTLIIFWVLSYPTILASQKNSSKSLRRNYLYASNHFKNWTPFPLPSSPNTLNYLPWLDMNRLEHSWDSQEIFSWLIGNSKKSQDTNQQKK